MKLFSKKPAEVSSPSHAAGTEPLSAERADEILREYSPEDNERQLTKWVARVVNVFSLFISLFLVYGIKLILLILVVHMKKSAPKSKN